jgi:hypothetical protein
MGYEASFDRFEALYALEHAYEQKQEGKNVWGPAKAGLFGGSVEKFKEVALEYSSLLSGLAWY